jgi:hypothetical protein
MNLPLKCGPSFHVGSKVQSTIVSIGSKRCRNDRRSSTEVTEIALVAEEGRVESLVVAVDREIYGS